MMNQLKTARGLVTILIALIISMLLSCSEKQVTSASIICVSGSAQITHPGKSAQAVMVNDQLTKGDILTTGRKSFVMVQLADQIMVRIQSDTTVEATRILEGKQSELYLTSGQLVSNVKKMMKDDGFTVRTPTALAAVRGTQYSISYYKDRSILAVKEGKVQLVITDIPKDNGGEKLVETGNSVVISKQPRTREITKFESMEIDKINGIPFASASDIADAKKLAAISESAIKQESTIEELVIKNGGPIPQNYDQMKLMFGRVDQITLYSNKQITGVIVSRGNTVKIVTLDGIESVPFTQIRNTRVVK